MDNHLRANQNLLHEQYPSFMALVHFSFQVAQPQNKSAQRKKRDMFIYVWVLKEMSKKKVTHKSVDM